MNNKSSIFPVTLLLISVLVLVSYGSSSIAITNNQVPVKELRLFSDIYKQIKLHYVEEVADAKLFSGAVKGMLRSANPSTKTSTEAEEEHYEQLIQESDTITSGNNRKLPLKKLRLISDLYGEITHKYPEIEGGQVFEGAINGMLHELDPYSTYLTARAYQNLKIGTDGKFGGLGIVVSKQDKLLKVMEVLPKTPAAGANLQAQDIIAQIEDKLTEDLSLADAVDMMRGERGTKINLLIKREPAEELFPVTIVRDIIKRESVKHVFLENNIGYVRISNFQINTNHELKNTLAKLSQEHDIQGLILDLRFNPGGILNEAIAVSDVFLHPKQLVVYTQGRKKSSKTEYKTRTTTPYLEIPTVVLINRGSASASEIVTGALKDHGRAIIMGQKSFGKASVQTVLPIDKTSALKLTTAHYYTPAGHQIHEIGIIPDIFIEEPKPKENTEKHAEEGESTDQQTTTSQDQKDAAEKEEGSEEEKWISFDDRVKQDPQIDKASAHLQTMIQVAKKP